MSVWESTSRFERECEAEQDAQLKINGRDGCMRRLGTGLELLLLVKSEGAGEGVDELLLEMECIFSRKEVLMEGSLDFTKGRYVFGSGSHLLIPG